MAKNPAKIWHTDANLHVYVHLDCKSMRGLMLCVEQNRRVWPFSNNLTMIAGMFRVSCNNDSRVYNQSLIGKKGQRSWSQKRFGRAVKIEPTNIRVLLILTGKKSKVFTTYWVGLWTGIVLSNTWVFVLVNCFGVFRGPGSRNTPSPVEFGCQWTDSPTCPRRTSSSCRIRSLLCN